MIPKNIAREHILKAIEEVKKKGIPQSSYSKKFHLEVDGEQFPPRYIIQLANKYANGRELKPQDFTSREARQLLKKLGFSIVEASKKFKLTYEIQAPEAVNKNFLETFDYQYPGKKIEVLIDTEEFTSLCPWSGLPDFANLVIRYIPNKKCIELKSLKYYLLSYRNVGIAYEHAVNKILEDLVEVSDPLEMHIEMDFKVRGGIRTKVKASYTREGIER